MIVVNTEPRVLGQLPAFALKHAKPRLQDLFSRQPLETHESGSAIFWEGDPATHVFKVVEGVLRIFNILADGRRIITGFIYPGEILGLSLDDRYRYTAEAVNEVKLRRFSRSRFREAIDESSELRPLFVTRLCEEMASAQKQMVLLASKSAEERVCSLLLALARRGESRAKPVVALPMSRLDMADYLGLTIETVSRTLTSLTNRGVIEPSSRYAFTICRLSTLVSLAGEGDADDNPTGAGSARQATRPH